MYCITPKEAIKYLRERGNAYVVAAITKDDTFKVKVDKSYLIDLFSQFDDNSACIGYSTFNDGTDYSAQLYDSYGIE